ncbi:MAG TPA: adenylate/guanylate cyclase domain-containing protein [Pseudomonadales bacterium]|nr:adenylate/guanylate cyclase domain-containing protein [Pseudomonadales bacterium]
MRIHHPARHLLAIALFVALAFLCLSLFTTAFARIDFLWLDKLTAWQAKQETGDPDIVLIDIDDYSLQAMAGSIGRWPWPRATHAELVEWLEQQGVRAIAFDIWFSEPDVLRPEFDQYFGDVLNRQQNIFLPVLQMNSTQPELARRLDSYATNLPVVRTPQANPAARADLLLPAMGAPEHWQLGLINYLADNDGIARHYQLRKEQQGWQLLSLPQVLAAHLGFTRQNETGDMLRMAWHGDGIHSPYRKWSYADVWQEVQTGKPVTDFHNKIVFIGATAAGLHDLRPTPIHAQYPGLYLLANAFDNLKNRHAMTYSNIGGTGAGLLLLLWMGWHLHQKKNLLATATQFLFAALLLLALSVAAISRHTLLPVVTPLLAGMLLLGIGTALRYWEERAARQAAIDMFGRFLDPLVVEQLAAQGLNEQTLAGKHCEISVLFSDIRGFTSMSEKATAAEIMALLNAYFTRQVGVIFKHHGTLDKFIGDAIMAFWGAPVADDNHAIDAVNAALDMVDELEQFRKERGLAGFDVGIGIHSGPAVVGMLGCDQRLEYTAIGDTVNLGSRLEGMTKGIARILVSQSTRDLCGEHFDFVSHGSCKVKGREEAVNIYEPIRKIA